MGRCKNPNCNGTTEYVDSAQGVVCTTCGDVAAQDLLVNEPTVGEGSSFYFGPTTLHRLRGMRTVLHGQSTAEDRARRNKLSIQRYITSILDQLHYPGLAPRCHYLFDLAKFRLNFRWGQSAVLAAGGCIMIALRENKKGVTTSKLATIMDVPPLSLTRALYKISRAVDIQVTPYDPLSFLPTVQSHFMNLMDASTLPKNLLNLVQSLSQHHVLRTAFSLSSLILDSDEVPAIGKYALPTACALFVHALQAEAATALPACTALLEKLAFEAAVARDVVKDRYRAINKFLEVWMKDIPWLSGADDAFKMAGRTKRGSGRRGIIAQSTKDIIQFQQEIRLRKKAREALVSLTLEVDEEESGNANATEPRTGQKRKHLEVEKGQQPYYGRSIRLVRSKKTKSSSSMNPVDIACLSLLSPNHPLAPTSDSLKTASRLECLLFSKGGESNIVDEELFDPDEWNDIFRSEDEVEEMRTMLGWEAEEEQPNLPVTSPSTPPDWQVWEDMVNEETESGEQMEKMNMPGALAEEEQIIGEWKEASPDTAEDVFDTYEDW